MSVAFFASVLVAVGVLPAAFCGASQHDATRAPDKSLPFVSLIFAGNMFLQRSKLTTIWAWTKAGAKVQVEIGKTRASGVAGPDRR
jgi:hypothetical protein